jgi:hypothetical protein
LEAKQYKENQSAPQYAVFLVPEARLLENI